MAGRQTPPMWEDPCGGQEVDDSSDNSPRSTVDLLEGIAITAERALGQAKAFRDHYVYKTFQVDFKVHQDSWAATKYDWLPNDELHKGLEEQVDESHLNQLELDAWLVSINRFLQTFAVGLEKVHEDMAFLSSPFREEFMEMQFKLRKVLCEVRAAIKERHPKAVLDKVPREVMAEEYRNMRQDSTTRNFRDWLIFRDYMICLEYILEGCVHFQRELGLEPGSAWRE